MPELRRDRLTGELVLLAPGRAGRPHPAPPRAEPPAGGACPFCPGHEGATPPEVARIGSGRPDGPGWRVRAFPNLYPIVGGEDAAPDATGAHEVVVLSPDHDRDLGRLADDAVRDVFTMLRERARVHGRAGRAYVQVVVNQGQGAGASLPHPHAQVVALDFVPPAVNAAVARFAAAGVDLVVDDHTAAGSHGTALFDRDATAAWCAPASSFPYEVRVAALRARRRFADTADGALAAVAVAVRDSVRALGTVVNAGPYNAVIYDAPTGGDDPYHWWVRIAARTAVPAGFELGTGVLVQTVDPARAAEQLRSAAGG